MPKILQKTIRWDNAYDRTHPNPSKNYGNGAMKLVFALVGEEGAVQFYLYTPFYLPHVLQRFSKGSWFEGDYQAFDLGYHSKVPMYENHSPIHENCIYTDGPCYYDGSSLAAEHVYTMFTGMGETALWYELLKYYNDIFETEYSEMSDMIESYSGKQK